jgi:hypothetical protein
MAKISGQPLNTDFLCHFDERCADTVTIVVTPAFDRMGRRRHELFEARLKNRDQLICVSAQPLLDCCRILLQAGYNGTAVLKKVHASNPDRVTLSAPIQIGARFDVMGDRFVRRKPQSALMSGPVGARSGPSQAVASPDSKAPCGPSDKGGGA